jgi:hypothetical protein
MKYGKAQRRRDSDTWAECRGFRSAGEPLTPGVRAPLEARFGHDFSEVRVHADMGAQRAARGLGAGALAAGHDLAFAEGRYAPETGSGLRLLAHELAHVVQWEESSGGTAAIRPLSCPEDSAEIEAEAAASKVVAGESVQVESVPAAAIARSPDEYSDEAYGIMNSSMDPLDRVQALVDAENRELAGRNVPPVSLGVLPDDSGNLGEGNFSNWALDLNTGAMDPSTPEGRADAANTVGHEGLHLDQWYQMARLQAGLEPGQSGGPLGDIPPSVATQASADPILQSDEQTYQVQQWYDSVYGSGAGYRNEVLSGEDAAQGVSRDMRAEYCRLPEERDAWERGMQVTDRYRQLEQLPTPLPALDPSICNPDPEEQVCR